MKLYGILFITIAVVFFVISYSEASPNSDMNRQTCFLNIDCPKNFVCHKSVCSNPCRNNGGRYPNNLGLPCGRNAECKTMDYEGSHCTCIEGFVGNPLHECVQ
ncbi:hypothetical protein PV326_004128, partial [Microctonus aethiopoides]